MPSFKKSKREIQKAFSSEGEKRHAKYLMYINSRNSPVLTFKKNHKIPGSHVKMMHSADRGAVRVALEILVLPVSLEG